jgi:hypothetical protein
LFAVASIGKYNIYASNAKGDHNLSLTPAEVLTNLKEALYEFLLDLQNQVAVEKTGRNGFSQELIG